MDGDVKVLLVSAGASPDALITELVRLGVTITECSFAEAEENLETDPPDLVALSGALGAVELANMIDDLEEGPRMVIVAERKELAKLRGLNREVVVSLFAMETTERVVGQRIESLARRAARRRQHRTAPERSVQGKTSLGLPLASSPVGRVDFKKPPLAKPAAPGEERPFVPPGNHPGLEPTPDPSGYEPSAPEQELANAGKPPAPQRPGVTPFESIPVMEDDLLESIRPEETDDESAPPPVQVPIISAVALSDTEVLSHPPTLPPAAKAQKGQPRASFESSPGDLDLSAVEEALDSLEGATNEITPDLVDHAQKEMGHGVPPTRPEESDDTTTSAKEDSEPAPLASEEPLEEKRTAGEHYRADPVSTWAPETADREPPGHDRAVDPLGATSLGDESDSSRQSASGLPTIEAGMESPADASEEPTAGGSHPHPKKNGGAGWFLAVAVALGAAAFAYKVVVLDKRPGSSGDKQQELVQVSEPKAAPNSVVPDGVVPDSSASEGVPDGSASPIMNETEESASGRPATRSNKLSEPFKRPDVKKPSCEVVLQGNQIEPGKDPVREASLVWQEARAAIVGGNKEHAHVLMCQAVTLNPESAAIEGLAQHYLSEGAYSEARVWAEKAETIRPGQREVNNLRGDIYGMMGDVEKARAVWLSTLNIRPEERSRIAPVSKDYSVEAGRHLRRGDLVRAELFFRRAIILDSENVSGMIGLAKVYQRMNEPEYARAFSEMSLRVSDHIPEVHVLLGELSLQQGNRAEAKTHFERALSVRPDFFPAKRGLSQVKQ